MNDGHNAIGGPRPDLEAVTPPVPTGPAITLYAAHCPRCLWNWFTRYAPNLCPHCGFGAITVDGDPPRKGEERKPRRKLLGAPCHVLRREHPESRRLDDEVRGVLPSLYICDTCYFPHLGCSSPSCAKTEGPDGDTDAFGRA